MDKLSNNPSSDHAQEIISPELELFCERMANLLVDQVTTNDDQDFDRRENKDDN